MSSPDTEAAERRRIILEAFDAALDIDASALEAWLKDRFGEDEEAIAAVRALLEADEIAPSAMPTELPGEGERTILVAPQRIGAYKLENIIGAGGMGEVWRGVRDDGLFDQEVAIKLMRPSRYATEALAFFDTERRALARLNHRHIARLNDGGVTETGLPWFIMELVDGLPLHVYAAGRKPDRTAILKLMAAITEATQYAHQQLVVHADLKPSNILITAAGEPCLVDFGIASLAATAAEQADKVAFPSTPAYASPQRLKGEAPTPSDDIFSLGLLLHGLLTQSWPEKPVTGPLSSTGDATCDAVIAKACAPESADRYVTAHALAEDIHAILESRPTSLQQGDWRQQSRLFIRRHPRAVSAAVAGTVGTLAALVLITGLYFKAEYERNRAQQRFNDVRALAGYMLGDFNDELVRLPGAAGLRARTTEVGRQYLSRLSTDNEAPVEILRDVAIGYGRVGNAQATTSTNATGNVKAGEDSLKKSEALLRDLIKRFPQRDDFKRELARTLTWKSGVILGVHNDAKGARAALDEAFALYDEVLSRNPRDWDAAYGRWNTVLGLGDVLLGQEKTQEIATLMQDTLKRYADLPVPAEYRSQRPLLEAATENNLGDATYYLVNPQTGVSHYKRALVIIGTARVNGVTDVRLPMREAYYNYQLSTSFQDVGEPQKALIWVDRGAAIASELNRYDDSALTLRLRDMISLQRASVLGDLGRHKEALQEAEESVDRRRQKLAQQPEDMDNHLNLAAGLHTLNKFYVSAKMTDKACATARESLALYAELAASGGVPEKYQRLDVEPEKAFVATCPRQ